MNPNDPNVFLLERAAEPLGEALLEQLVFVGGTVAGVLITDPAMPEIRPTQDVDVICSVHGRLPPAVEAGAQTISFSI
jgi:hypothetical protein